jgi:hypothetical protein
MKEAQLKPKIIYLFTEMLHLLLNKEGVMNYWSLVLKSSIYWLLIQEEERLDFSEEQESEKLCLFKN